MESQEVLDPKTNKNPRLYADVNLKKNEKDYNYEKCLVSWNKQDKYQIIRRLGRGKFSDVFQGINIETNNYCTIKVLKPVRGNKINREIKILENLNGLPNIVRLIDVCKNPVTGTSSLVLDYMDNVPFRQLYSLLDLEKAKYYLYNLLVALDLTHKNGIMHRDIKPNNILFDLKTGRFSLIDWGLAEFYFPDVEYNVRVSTRYFKAPELLLNYGYYHYSLDMWSFGCVMAGILFKKEPFFRGDSRAGQLKKLYSVLGTLEFEEYIKKFQMDALPESIKSFEFYPKIDFARFVNKHNKDLVTSDGIDLICRLLVVDHSKRLYACEAMLHPFFDSVRSHFENKQ